MRNFKRILALAVTGTLLFVVGCGGNTKNSDSSVEESNAVQAFELKAPDNEDTGVENTPTFEWSISKKALKYTLYVSTNESFDENALVYTKANIANPYHTYVGEGLTYGATYYWKVEAVGKGEGNILTAANAPFSFTVAQDTTVDLVVSHLSYMSGDTLTANCVFPEGAENVKLQIATADDFSVAENIVANEVVSTKEVSVNVSKLSGKHYAKLFATINGEEYSSDSVSLYFGESMLFHDFTSETGNGDNGGVRNWSGAATDQLDYKIADGCLKINYAVGSYLDYVIIDLPQATDKADFVRSSKYMFLRFKAEEYVGGLLLKMRGDDSKTNNWKDYTVLDVSGSDEWKEVLIPINTENVANFNRLVFGIMTSKAGSILIDDIYFVK